MCDQCKTKIKRRVFMGLTTSGVAGAGLALAANPEGEQEAVTLWDPDKPITESGQKLRIQPVLLYATPRPKKQRSWRNWGGIQTKKHAVDEVNKINNELETMIKKAGVPLEALPVVKINNNARRADELCKKSDCDVMLVYAAGSFSRSNPLDRLFSDKRDNIVFLRHKSGPIYLWYEILHNRFLRKGPILDEYRYPAGMTIHDVVVDEYNDLAAKLTALYGIKNFIGKRIVSLGPASGWSFKPAPQIAREKYKLDIREVTLQDLSRRIKSAKANVRKVVQAEKLTEQYLKLPRTSLHTDKAFVRNNFLLYSVFKDYMQENDTDAFTIKDCMGAVIPIIETTACLTLSLLNDQGYMAFCESDFNVIPSGILLRHISGKPVFLNDPTFPHHGVVTVAHCTGPRRMDGKNYAPAKIVTHYESDYGAAPKVDLPKGTEITMIAPHANQKRWLGFKGKVIDSPFYDICRTQYDIEIEGDWEKLLEEHRGFHWMMTCGDCIVELEYACRKIGVDWLNCSKA